MQNTKENDASGITVTPAKKGFETFSITLKNGQLKKQQLQVVLDFVFINRPFNSLKIIHNMMINYMRAPEAEETQFLEWEGLRETLLMLTNLWAAEHEQYEPFEFNDFQ